MRKSPILLVLILLLASCSNKNDCSQLPSSYNSYEEAMKTIEASSFKIEESINTSKSSWIKGATFYSCDSIQGFFILKTKRKDYLYSSMPIEIWNGFKNAESFGSYYHKFIKNRYIFELDN